MRFRSTDRLPWLQKTTMVELHSNFTPEGSKKTDDGTYPTNHQLHESLEITQGINDWAEVGFYLFTSWQDRPRRSVGGRSYSAARAGARLPALAGWRQPLDRGGVSAIAVFSRHLDLGDSAHCR